MADRSGDVVDDLVGGDRQRRGVDDQPVDELGDLVDGVGQDASRHDEPQVVGVLDPVDQPGHRVGVEQVGVVDDHGVETGRDVTALGEWAELAAQAEHAGRRRLADEPRLAVARRRLEQHHPGGVGAGESAEQRRAGKAHEGLGEPIDRESGGVGCAALAGPSGTDSAIRLPSRLAARRESLLAVVVACQASRPVAGSATRNRYIGGCAGMP